MAPLGLTRPRGGSRPAAVLHLVDCLNPGGTERQLIEQCRRIDRARWRPLVAVFHANGLLAPELDAIGVHVGEFPLRTRLAHPNTARQVARLVALCRAERARIVHAHDFYANLLGVAVARLGGARLVASRRDLMHWLSPAKTTALRLACRAADRVVANAEALATATVEGLGIPRARVRVVPNGIDLGRFDREAARSPDPPLGPFDGAPIVAVISNMNLPAKGHADLLEAAARLAADGRRFHLVLVGDGEERPALQGLAARLGLARRVRFLGRRLDVPRLLARADAACLPSWAEGLPNAVLEAMAAALPVVATAVGGCPELVEDGLTGLLVPPRAPDRLAAALASLFDRPRSARAMGQAARRRVASHYSLERSVGLLDAIYSELA